MPFHLGAESRLAPFSRSFPDIDFLMHFGRPLAHFWFPFGSRWLTLGSLWLTFGSRWLTFGSLWLPFGSLLMSLGSLLMPFASLLLTRESIFSLLLYPVLMFRIFSIFHENIMQILVLNNFQCKSHSRSIKSYFPEAHRTHPNRKYIFSGNPPFKGPERNICRRQLRLID